MSNTGQMAGKTANKGDCKICGKLVKTKDKGITCDICEGWHHSSCTGMSDIQYNFYKDEEKTNWVCTNCIKNKKEENSIRDILKDIKKSSEDDRENMKQERNQMMDMMKQFTDGMMKQLTDQINRLEDKIETKMNDKIRTSERGMMLKLNDEMDERFERLKRKNNVILYGLPESKKENVNDRLIEDIEKTRVLLEKIEVDIEKFKLFRLGNKINPGKIRPVKLEMAKEEDKYSILKGAGKIRNIEDEEFKKIIISSDLTLKQRELDRILRDELKVRRQAGETNIKIKNGRIVNVDVQGQGTQQ